MEKVGRAFAMNNRIAVCWLAVATLLACGRTALGKHGTSQGTPGPADAGEAEPPLVPVRTTWDQFPRFCSVDGWCGSSVVFQGVWGSASDDVWVVATGVARNGPSSPFSAVLHWDGSDWLMADWSSAFQPNASTSTQASLYGIWGSAVDDVWTVGSGGTVVHWNGSHWSSFASITSADLRAVWGSSAQDVWAVGAKGTILHYDGEGWLVTPAAATTADLFAVWGSSADSVWAVGARGTILHWTGSAWSAVASGIDVSLGGVWGSGPRDVWAVGAGGTVLHWDGSAWSAAAWSDGSKWDLVAVWGGGADDVWAVGAPTWAYPQGSYPYSSGGIAHWDGVAWSTVPIRSMSSLNAVWGSASNNVWAVGGGSLRWNGTDWLRSDPARSNLYAAWGTAANDVWALGEYGIVVHWDGDGWSTALDPLAEKKSGCAGNRAYGSGAIWGSGAHDVWATTETTDLLHWNGSVWSTVPTGASGSLVSLWGSGASDVWAVGCKGRIAHWDGRTWSEVPSPTRSALLAVSGTAPHDVWAAGEAGVVVHWDGARWSPQDLPTVAWAPYGVGWDGTEWYVVSSTAPHDVWVMGAWTSAGRGGGYQGPAASHWNGSEWSNSKEPVAGTALWINGSDDRWLVGTSLSGFDSNHPQEIAHWNGIGWSDSLSGGSVDLAGIWGSRPRDLWAVGARGAILRKR
jgi:hypothetical protein